MRLKKILYLFLLILLQGCSVVGVRNYEILPYEILLQEKNFEVRLYDDYLVAAVSSANNYKESSSSSFGLLFKYISGYNVSSEKIEMTAPVLQQENSAKIEMTAPVLQQKTGDKWEMSFVLPSKYTLKNVPEPLDPRIVIKEIKSRKVAVVHYSGILNEKNIQEYTLKLLKWMDDKGYESIGSPYSAGYDPPWTIPFFRRNEILVEIK